VLVGIRPADLRPDGEGVRITLLAGEGTEPDGSARLRHPALARAAEQDPAVSAELLARVDPAGRRAVPVYLDPARVLLFDPETGAAL
jgi:predicted exporter